MAILLQKQVNLRAVAQTDVAFSDGNPIDWSGDLLVYGIHTEAVSGGEQERMSALDQAMGGQLREFLLLEGFAGHMGTSRITRRANGSTRLFGVVGLGPVASPQGPSPFRVLGEQTAIIARSHGARSAGVALLSSEDTLAGSTAPRRHDNVHDLKHRGRDIALGIMTGGYRSDRFKSVAAPPQLRSATVFSLGSSSDMRDEAHLAAKLAHGVTLCRHLAEAPANLCTPQYLAQAAQSIADAVPEVMSLQVLDVAKCSELGMGCYLAVGAASTNLPHFIHLIYSNGSQKPAKKVALIGKSICFDSGGLNLKVHGGIEKMKMDMAGGAAVLGAAEALSQIRPEGIEVHFILPAAENAVSGSAVRPSDIVTASNGKTVEIEDTDAEGRLVLADALVYAERLGVDAVIDIATLTSACITALGPLVGGFFTDSEQMARALQTAAQSAGESIWHLPLESRYRPLLDSTIADIKNYGGAPAGAITAALFLKEFLTSSVQWAHIDAGGPTYDADKKVATGWGVLTLTHWVLNNSKAHTVAKFGFKDIPPSPAKDTGHRGK